VHLPANSALGGVGERKVTHRQFSWTFLAAISALLSLVPAAPALGQSCQYWVAPPPAGNDGNPGTLSQPWATLDHASASVPDNTCTVWFRDGVYSGTHSLYERFTTTTTFKAINSYRAILQHSGTVLKAFGAKNMIFEGFEFRHSGPGAGALVVQVQKAVDWSENITFRNNVFHDSYDNDLLKINNGARFVTVENNVFYNQTGSDEHIDVNSVTDITIRDNIFFNDFGGSGRPNGNDTSSFIVIKDSNDNTDGLEGSERITVRRNIFLNWQGSSGSNFVLVGEDGKPYHEAKDVLVENNLMIGNAANDIRAAFGVKGGKNITFRNNTVVGDLPSLAYALRVNREGLNPVNENIFFHNNIWADPTGTMGAEAGGGVNEFSDGDPAESTNLVLDKNLYWNGGAAIPPGDLVSPLIHDARRVVGDPSLSTNHAAIILPRWNGSRFVSGNATVRQEFERLVNLYGTIPGTSLAVGAADPALAPADDILGRPRVVGLPDMGAYESSLTVAAISPTSGPSAGGTNVTLTGTNFQSGAGVRIGGVSATGVSVPSSIQINATTPALSPGTLNDVVVTNLDASTATLARGWLADFLDVPGPHAFHDFVEKIFRNGITSGCGGGNYCPGASVPRDQMAVFLLRGKYGGSYVPPPATGMVFNDVPITAFAAAFIEQLFAEGITSGCSVSPPLYCPGSPVTRGQMAVFLLRTKLRSGYMPPAATGIFGDVPVSDPFAPWIEDLFNRGITAGCGGGNYCPNDPNTRGQMAVFLARTFNLP